MLCTCTHALSCSPRRYTHEHTNAGGTEESSVPICCAPGPLSGGSQTGMQPCLDWHWSTHKHSGACSHSAVCVCVCVFTFFTRDMLKNWEHVKKKTKHHSHFHTWKIEPFKYVCVWLWFTLLSQRERFRFDSLTETVSHRDGFDQINE